MAKVLGVEHQLHFTHPDGSSVNIWALDYLWKPEDLDRRNRLGEPYTDNEGNRVPHFEVCTSGDCEELPDRSDPYDALRFDAEIELNGYTCEQNELAWKSLRACYPRLTNTEIDDIIYGLQGEQ